MGIFYNPPQPPTANSGGTPPEPHIPVGNQGSQPPRHTAALMLAVVVATWPTDLEPRLPVKVLQNHIAPLTLVYGSQPPVIGITPVERQVTFSSWPLDLEPRLSTPNNIQQKIAPLTLVYGQSPPLSKTSQTVTATILGNWPLDLEPRLGIPNNTQQKIAPLTLIYGNQPPRLTRQLTNTVLSWIDTPQTPRQAIQIAATIQIVTSVPNTPQQKTIWSAWLQTTEIRPTLTNIAPLSLTYGDQPSVIGSYTKNREIVVNSWPLDLEPRLGIPNNTQQKIVPLTLVYGSEPPRFSLSNRMAGATSAWVDAPFSIPRLIQLLPQVSFVPYTSLQRAILTAWLDSQVQRFIPVNIAPLTLVYGSQPAPRLQTDYTKLVDAWTQIWGPQTAKQSAGWNYPILSPVTYAPLPKHIWAAWELPFIRPPVPVSIAPLTLVYGQQPPPRLERALFTTLTSWEQVQSIPRALAQNAAWNSVQFVPYRSLPLQIRAAWNESFIQIPKLISSIQPFILVPRTTLSQHILLSWQLEQIDFPRRINIAPLTLRYGSQPIPRGPIILPIARDIFDSWPADLEPRLGKPNAEQVHIVPLTLAYGNQPTPRLLTDYTKLVALWTQDWAAQSIKPSASWFITIVGPKIVRVYDESLSCAIITSETLQPVNIFGETFGLAAITDEHLVEAEIIGDIITPADIDDEDFI